MKSETSVAAAVAREWPPLIRSSSIEVFEMMLNVRLEPSTQAPIPIPECTALVGLTGSLWDRSRCAAAQRPPLKWPRA
jgi:hypothetical protein